MLLSRNTKIVEKDEAELGRLYLFRFILKDGTIVHKVGMCNSDRSTDRFFEVLRSFFMVYRYSPQAVIKRDKSVEIPYIVENHFHKILSDLSYKFDKSFSGSKEFFYNVDEDELIDYIDNFKYSYLFSDYTGKLPKAKYYQIRDVVEKLETPTIDLDDKPPWM